MMIFNIKEHIFNSVKQTYTLGLKFHSIYNKNVINTVRGELQIINRINNDDYHYMIVDNYPYANGHIIFDSETYTFAEIVNTDIINDILEIAKFMGENVRVFRHYDFVSVAYCDEEGDFSTEEIIHYEPNSNWNVLKAVIDRLMEKQKTMPILPNELMEIKLADCKIDEVFEIVCKYCKAYNKLKQQQ